MTNKASDEKRVAKPSRISIGKKCSPKAAIGAASSGGSKGKRYSLRNSSRADSDMCGQPNWNSPAIRSMAKPSIFVCPDFQKMAAIEKRPIRAISESGIRENKAISPSIRRETGDGEAGYALVTEVFMLDSLLDSVP